MVLGMIPLARELLQGGCEVVVAANSLPAINDVTVWELQSLLESASACCPLLAVRRPSGSAHTMSWSWEASQSWPCLQ